MDAQSAPLTTGEVLPPRHAEVWLRTGGRWEAAVIAGWYRIGGRWAVLVSRVSVQKPYYFDPATIRPREPDEAPPVD